ncbi:hypothetical protein WR25_17110 [Diploscapter pachys]|uniref:Glucosylceramidase n=1 Tax=Diploscapter pachys TaxID=2018661 RepID=A0A2A2JA33_9BILA|nr:hypothetical protein WR25_17110 [Diploscapter pachys]
MFLKQYCTALILLVATELIEAQYPCAPRTYKDGYSVCVCNSTYCDSIEPPGQLQKGTGALYYSSKQGARMRKTIVSSQRSAPGQSKFLEIDSSQQFQKIFGFGATFTDASMVNINSLPKEMGANIIKQYYSRESGIGYTFGRVPMGATDFSTKGYTYDDVENDFDLRNFAIPQDEILGDAFAAKHVAGIGLHWYDDRDFNAFLVNNTHYKWPQYFILSTEVDFVLSKTREHVRQMKKRYGELARTDWRNGKTHVVLGDWTAGAGYASNVIQDLHTWYSGWIDMNLALDTEGGPSWTKNIADAPIIVNASATEYYKQPMYHAIAHFSKFIQPNATRIAETWMSLDTIGLDAVAFLNPDGTRTVVIHNYEMLQVGVNIVEKTNPGYYYSFEMDPYSIATLTIN